MGRTSYNNGYKAPLRSAQIQRFVLAKVYVPRISDNNVLRVDGEIVSALETGSWIMIDNVPSGTHLFEIKKRQTM